MNPLANASPVSPAAYWDPGRHRAELERIFRRHWLFAGFAGQLRKPNDFITVQAGDRSVVVCNFNGRLRALHNVCSHRHAILKDEPCGNGPLRCRYHGWTYDEEGRPSGIPANRENFAFEDRDKQRWGLERYDVEQVGEFVFVRVASSGPSLREHLGPLAKLFETLQQTFSMPFEEGARDWACNWKIGVENTLESYHVAFAHQETLAAVLDSQGRMAFQAPHSSVCHKMLPESVAWWNDALRRSRLVRCEAYDDYHHFFIYPNLCIGLTYGALSSVQTFEPLTSCTSRLKYRLLLPSSDAAEQSPPAFRRVLCDYLREFNEKVLEEDGGPVQWCQEGCREMRRAACLGASEARISAFLNAVVSDASCDPAGEKRGDDEWKKAQAC
ncbi:MAG TPA: aromatic ring-hydroxylating dioxygenase subunit alpha [Pirellulales bacterium]|nr:aromatic ring-hydroxylating dioxygenase subunit alpha [Pirellulales bacterium]